MATATESKKMIRLRSDDGEEFEIEESVAKQFRTKSKKHVDSSWSKVIEYSNKKITLRSSDGVDFEIEEGVAKEFKVIKKKITLRSFDDDDCVISVPNVDSEVLSKAIEYATKHVLSKVSSSKSDEKTAEEELKAWDAKFILDQKDDMVMYFNLIMAAHYYLGIESLTRLAVKKWRWREDIRKVFNGDFFEEE